jgi:Protein of unknown function (DUF3168)
MAIAEGFQSMIAAATAVTDIVADRVYPSVVKLADKVYPLITYKFDNTTTTNTYDGPVNPLRSCNIVLECIGNTYAEADELAAALLATMDGSSGTWGSTVVQGCFLNDDSVIDDVVTEPETEEILLYIKELSFLVWYVAS